MFTCSRSFALLLGSLVLVFVGLCASPGLQAQHLRFDEMFFLIDTQDGDTADVYINGSRVGTTPYLLTLVDLNKNHFCNIRTPLPKVIDADASFTAFSNSGLEVQTFVRNARPEDSSFVETFTFRVQDGAELSNCTLLVSVIDRRGNYIPCLRGKLQSEGEDLFQKWYFGMI